MNWIRKILGGRPMRFDQSHFRDRISGDMVNFYTDTLGRRWLATSSWSLFRVRRADCDATTGGEHNGK